MPFQTVMLWFYSKVFAFIMQGNNYRVLKLVDPTWKMYHNNDDVIKWKHFPRYWPFVGGIHRSPVNSPHKGQWRGALMFYLICAWINGWVNKREAGGLRRHRAHYDVIVICCLIQVVRLRWHKKVILNRKETRTPIQYPIRRRIVRFRIVSKPRDLHWK